MKRKTWCKYLYEYVLQRSDKQGKWQDTIWRRRKGEVYRIVKRRRLNPDYDGHDETRPYEGRKGRIIGNRPL